MAENKKGYGPAVENGQLLYTSVSAMDKARTCMARWGFRYVKRLPDDPPGKGQIRGDEGHKRVEHYLKTGQNILDPLEQKGIEKGLIPSPGPDLLVEMEIGQSDKKLLAGSVPLQGKIDLVNPRFLRSEGLLEVTDWKFKKSITKYGAKEDELLDPYSEPGLQMVGYAEFIRRNAHMFPGLNRLRLRHVTFQTEGAPKVEPVAVETTLTELENKWETVSLPLIEKMAATALEPDSNKWEKNKEVCWKYHKPCPYLRECQDPLTRVVSRFM